MCTKIVCTNFFAFFELPTVVGRNLGKFMGKILTFFFPRILPRELWAKLFAPVRLDRDLSELPDPTAT